MDTLLAAYGSASCSDSDGDGLEQPPSAKRRRRSEGEEPDAAAAARHNAPATRVTTTSLPSAAALLASGELPAAAAGPLLPSPAAAAAASQPAAAAAASSSRPQHHQHQAPEPERVRTFPHVPGNFATVVYIAVPEAAHRQLHELTATLLAQCPAATAAATAAAIQLWPTHPVRTPGGAAAAAAAASPGGSQHAEQPPQQLPLHVSISRTVPIRHLQIDSLKVALTKQLRPFKAARVSLAGLCALRNDAASRSFVGMRVAAGAQQVVKLIQAVNRAFALHGLQAFHEVPLPHVSLAWTSGDETARLQPWLDGVRHEAISMQVCEVHVQIGMLKHVVWRA